MQTPDASERRESYSFREWLESYPERATRRIYATGVGVFMRFTYKTTDTSKTEELATKYVSETEAGKRDYFRDLVGFIASMGDRPPSSAHSYVVSTRNFLLYCCNRDLTTRERREYRLIKSAGKVTDENTFVPFSYATQIMPSPSPSKQPDSNPRTNEPSGSPYHYTTYASSS
jgi:hypothetical protein